MDDRIEQLVADGVELLQVDGRWLRPSYSGNQTWTPVLNPLELVQQRLYRAELAARAATIRYAERIGVTPPATEGDDAVQWGDDRLEQFWANQTAVAAGRVAHDATVDSHRSATFERMAQRREVRGWKRLAESTACGACLALADGRMQPVSETRFYRHTRCQCIPIPVTTSSPAVPTGRQLFDALSVDEQDRVFRGHGGRAKAQALRDGVIDLPDLVRIADERLERTDYVVTEQPLAAVLDAAS
jgi:hypothetical protein